MTGVAEAEGSIRRWNQVRACTGGTWRILIVRRRNRGVWIVEAASPATCPFSATPAAPPAQLPCLAAKLLPLHKASSPVSVSGCCRPVSLQHSPPPTTRAHVHSSFAQPRAASHSPKAATRPRPSSSLLPSWTSCSTPRFDFYFCRRLQHANNPITNAPCPPPLYFSSFDPQPLLERLESTQTSFSSSKLH